METALRRLHACSNCACVYIMNVEIDYADTITTAVVLSLRRTLITATKAAHIRLECQLPLSGIKALGNQNICEL